MAVKGIAKFWPIGVVLMGLIVAPVVWAANPNSFSDFRFVGSGNAALGTLRVSYPVSGQNPVDGWVLSAVPAASTVAAATEAAGAAGVRHCLVSVNAAISAGGSAPTAGNTTVYIRDGSSGSGTALFSHGMSTTATAGQYSQMTQQFPAPLCGSAATALVVEFWPNASGSNTFQTLSAQGFDAS